jgi:hypothetical protein
MRLAYDYNARVLEKKYNEEGQVVEINRVFDQNNLEGTDENFMTIKPK